MPRLIQLHDIVGSAFKFGLMVVYSTSVALACVATVLMNVTLAGNAGGLVSTYALVGVLVVFKWVMFPRERE